MTAPPVPGLTVIGPVVILTGPAAHAAANAILIAVRTRSVNGLPRSQHYDAIAAALVSACGHADDRPSPITDSIGVPDIPPTVPISDAAKYLGLSKRQARRLAPNLGGRIIGGRWLLDAQAVTEHREGRHNVRS